jgi:hypothetical protein
MRKGKILREINEKIKLRKKQNKGGSIRCCTYGVTSEIINRHRRASPWLYRDA